MESLQKMTVEESVLYDEIIDREIATSEELEFARKLLYGSWEYVLNKVIYARTGYKNMWELIENEE